METNDKEIFNNSVLDKIINTCTTCMSSNLANITKILAATGEALDTSQRSSAAWHTTPKLCTKTAAEVDLIRARRLASSKTQRNAITKRIFRLRKKHLEDQAKQEMAKYFENSTGTRGSACFRKIRRSTATPIAQLGPPKQIPGQGLHNIAAAKGPTEISNMFADYFCHLYANEDFIILEWVQDKFDGHIRAREAHRDNFADENGHCLFRRPRVD